MKRKMKKYRFSKGESFLYTMGIFCFLLTFVLKVFASASIGNIKMDIEKQTYKIETQKKKNESLMMQVNELTSYENLNQILKDMGLSYNNENIIVLK